MALSFSGVLRTVTAAKYRCFDAGPCVNCAKGELEVEDCVQTGRKMKVLCQSTAGLDREDFRACHMTAEDEQNRVIVFQLLMGLCGGIAYYHVQLRKSKSATLFDQRQRRNRLSVEG